MKIFLLSLVILMTFGFTEIQAADHNLIECVAEICHEACLLNPNCTSTYEPEPIYPLTISTDKSFYNEIETIYITGILNEDTAVRGDEVIINILDYQNNFLIPEQTTHFTNSTHFYYEIITDDVSWRGYYDMITIQSQYGNYTSDVQIKYSDFPTDLSLEYLHNLVKVNSEMSSLLNDKAIIHDGLLQLLDGEFQILSTIADSNTVSITQQAVDADILLDVTTVMNGNMTLLHDKLLAMNSTLSDDTETLITIQNELQIINSTFLEDTENTWFIMGHVVDRISSLDDDILIMNATLSDDTETLITIQNELQIINSTFLEDTENTWVTMSHIVDNISSLDDDLLIINATTNSNTESTIKQGGDIEIIANVLTLMHENIVELDDDISIINSTLLDDTEIMLDFITFTSENLNAIHDELIIINATLSGDTESLFHAISIFNTGMQFLSDQIVAMGATINEQQTSIDTLTALVEELIDD